MAKNDGHQRTLTTREWEILERVARGMSNSAIASCLGISEGTVRNHLTHVFDKLRVASRHEAVALAYHASRPVGMPPRPLETLETPPAST